MSEDRRGLGFMAVMTNPPTEDQLDDFSEVLYETGTQLWVNSNGLIWCDFLHGTKEAGDIYHLVVGEPKQEQGHGREDFLKLLQKAGIEVYESTIKPYSCIWYNGCDSPLWDVQAEQLWRD